MQKILSRKTSLFATAKSHFSTKCQFVGSGAYNFQANTNQFTVLAPGFGGSDSASPTLQLTYKGPSLRITNDMTLKDLETSLMNLNMAKRSVTFYNDRQERLASSSKLRYVLEQTMFRMDIDNQMSYTVNSTQGYNEQIGRMTPGEHDFYTKL